MDRRMGGAGKEDPAGEGGDRGGADRRYGAQRQSSSRIPHVPVESSPAPPKSRRFPAASIHGAPLLRAPGTLPGAGIPCVPYVPICMTVSAPDGDRASKRGYSVEEEGWGEED